MTTDFTRARMRRLPQLAQRRVQGGFLMIEMALYLVIATILLATQVTKINEALENSLASATGQYMTELQTGINVYQQTNDVALKMAAPVVVGFVNPLTPTTAELKIKKYLSAGFSLVSPLGLTFNHQLTQVACPGVTCKIEGLTYSTTGYTDLGGIIRSDLLSIAVAKIGVDGGQSMVGSPGTISGYAGAFTNVNPVGAVAGVLAVRTGDQSGLNLLLAQFYKLDGSRSLLGNMDVNNFDLNNIKNLTSTGTATLKDVVVTGNILLSGSVAAGSACVVADVGKITKNVTGDGLVICNNNVWEIVGNAVSGITAGGACSTFNQLGTSAIGVAYVCNGVTWNSLSNYALAGDVCAPAGKTAISSATGEQLVCKNGRYVKLTSLLTKNVQVGAHLVVRDGDIVAKPVCDTSGVANYTLFLSQAGVDVSVAPPYQSIYVSATNNVGSWTILLRLKRSAADGGGEVSATTYGYSAVMTLECTY